MTNMLWVEQPVGTGFAQGKITAHNEVDVAKDFVGFFKNWETIFGIQNYKIYITVCNLFPVERSNAKMTDYGSW